MLITGDCLEELKKLPDDSVDCVVTDPPYGYSFMGKNWDKAVPSVDVWKECLRVLKPGAFAFVMSAPRQDVLSQMIVRIGEAGFDTDYTSIYWTYASGFPKAMNIGKMVDKREGAVRTTGPIDPARSGRLVNQSKDYKTEAGWSAGNRKVTIDPPATAAAKALDGSYGGFQPKPAVEVIIVAMKPLSEKTFVDQALSNGKGVTWLDDCRVPTSETLQRIVHDNKAWRQAEGRADIKYETRLAGSEAGRFPANLLVSDDVLNDGRVTKSNAGVKNLPTSNIYGGNSLLKSKTLGTGKITGISDSGSYSRYFDLDAWAKTLPFLITPKASKSEKNEGIYQRGGTNSHPTVKPLKLMSYLITLGSRKGDTILDPFMGSGTTGVAARELQREFIGIELSEEYMELAKARIEHANMQPELLAAE